MTTLDQLLGDPYDAANPYGFAAIGAGAALPAGSGTGEDLRALYRRSPRAARAAHPAVDDGRRLGAAIGAVDSGLRITLRHLRARRLYDRPAAEIPYLRSALAGVLADLLLCDRLLAAADLRVARGFVPQALLGAMDGLSVLLGSRFYIRVGEQAIFPVLFRETQDDLLALGTAGPAPVTDVRALLPGVDAPALHRDRGGWRTPPGPAADLVDDLFDRYHGNRSFDLSRRPLPDRP
jgi:nucleotide-binding universal stress UspA family protein